MTFFSLLYLARWPLTCGQNLSWDSVGLSEHIACWWPEIVEYDLFGWLIQTRKFSDRKTERITVKDGTLTRLLQTWFSERERGIWARDQVHNLMYVSPTSIANSTLTSWCAVIHLVLGGEIPLIIQYLAAQNASRACTRWDASGEIEVACRLVALSTPHVPCDTIQIMCSTDRTLH